MSKSKKTKITTKGESRAVRAPLAVGIKAKASKPIVNGNSNFKVHRREFVGTATNGAETTFMLTPTSLALPGYDFNPGVSIMFPWLSHVAVCYERFRFNSLKFDFIPSQAASTAGRYYTAIDYDYDDEPASTKAQLMGNLTCCEAAIWQPMTMVADKAALIRDLPYRYVSATQRTASVEQRTANSGYLMVAFDTPATNCLIDIWVEYDVELVTPVNDGLIVQTVECNLSTANTDPNVTVALGTGFIGFPDVAIGMQNGPIRLVQSGMAGIPALIFGFGGTNAYPNQALDIRPTKGKGQLELNSYVSVTGQAPSVLSNATNAMNFLWYGFDQSGNYLLDLLNSPAIFPVTEYSTAFGCDAGKTAVNGEPLRRTIAFQLESLLQAVPTVAFLVGFILNDTGAYGAGTSSFGFKYRN